MASAMHHSSSGIVRRVSADKVVDVEISVIKGRAFKNSHKLRASPSYIVELVLDNEANQTNPERSKGGEVSGWNSSFVYSATTSSSVKVRAYCHHQRMRESHVVGEASFDALGVGRYEDFEIPLYNPGNPTQKTVSGYVTLCIKVAISVTFDTGSVTDMDLRSKSTLQQMERMVGSLSPEGFKKLSPSWVRLFNTLGTFAPVAQKVAELDSRAQIAINAVASTIKILVEQIERDDKIDNLGTIMQGLYRYVLDLSSTQKILSYQKILERLLTQTSECAYFVAEYKRITIFAQRMVVNILVSNADVMISKFEAAFGELKIELILGSTLQTAIVSYRILRKVESIENLLYIDYLPTLSNVGWDSAKTCLRGTREETIGNIVRWASRFNETSSKSRIYIISGPVASGKSAIAHTIAQAFHEQSRLGAVVLLHKNVAGATAQTISSSIIEQLACYDPQIQARIADKIKSDKSLASADIARQFRALVVETTNAGIDSESQFLMVGPVLILIDGLDTIEEGEQHKFLTVIADYANKLLPNFRICITSRPSADLVEPTLGPLPYTQVREIGFDDLATDRSLNLTECISRYLNDLFAKKTHFAERWNEELESQFRKRARGIYFWVSLAHRALLASSDDDASLIVIDVLSNRLPHSNDETMDHLYRAILKTVYDRQLTSQTIFDILIKSPQPLTLSNIHHLACIPGDSRRTALDNIVHTLQKLGLVIERGEDGEGVTLYGVYPSLEDFLTNARRSSGTGIFVDREVPLKSLAEISLNVMNRLLQHNICKVEDLTSLNSEIVDLEIRVQNHIPGTLEYACRNWISHLEDRNDSLDQQIRDFMTAHLLDWIEVMSLLGRFDQIRPGLLRVIAWLKQPTSDNQNDETAYQLAMDAVLFVRMFSQILSKSAMQTYTSALPLMPSDTLLFETYSTTTILDRSMLSSNVRLQWIPMDPSPQIIDGMPLRCRPNSQTLVPMQATYHVFLWDSETRKQFEPRFRVVDTELYYKHPPSFSPDRRYFAHDNYDHDITVNDVEAGASVIHVIKGPFMYPLIRYSADGKRLFVVTTGLSSRFSIWDTETWNLVQNFALPVRGSSVEDVGISPDGKKIALPNDDGDGIQIFNVNTTGKVTAERLAGPHQYGSSTLRSARLVWSRDGNRLVSASLVDEMVCIWSLQDNVTRIIALDDWIQPTRFEFSADTSRLASLQHIRKGREPSEAVLRIWDTETGKLISKHVIDSTIDEDSTNSSILFLRDGHGVVFLNASYTRKTTANRFYDSSPAYATAPFNFHDLKPVPVIRYSCSRPLPPDTYASHVDEHGWICTESKERQIWVPFPKFSISASRGGVLQSNVIEIDILHPSGKVVLTYILQFKQAQTPEGELQEKPSLIISQ